MKLLAVKPWFGSIALVALMGIGNAPLWAQETESKTESPTTHATSPTSLPVSNGVTSPKTQIPRTGAAETAEVQEIGDSVQVLPTSSSPTTEPLQNDSEADRVMQRDLDSRVEIFRKGGLSIRMGALLQIQGAFFVGEQASQAAEDPADQEGFRVRRARFSFSGDLIKQVTYYLGIDLKDTVVAALGGDSGSEILDANIQWNPLDEVRIAVGMDKVAFSLFSLQSSSKLTLIERPIASSLLSPSRRVGISVFGDVWKRLRYAVGVFNGSDGVTSGNKLAGIGTAAFFQYHLFGVSKSFVEKALKPAIGGSFAYENRPAVELVKAGGNLDIRYLGARLVGEILFERSIAKHRPSGDPNAGSLSRWGAIGEVSAFAWAPYVELALRYERFHDNETLSTFGRQQLFTAGGSLYFCQHRLKLQVNYIRRHELLGAGLDNDIGFAQLQAMF